MSFQSPWSRISLRARWAISLLLAAAAVAALVLYVNHHDSNGEVPVSAKKFDQERAQADVVIGQEQAPHSVPLTATTIPAIDAALRAAVIKDMRAQITSATTAGPLQQVRCFVHGGTYARTGYHCVAKADDVNYPYLAVATPRAHHAWLCQKVYPPSPSENIPVSARCRA